MFHRIITEQRCTLYTGIGVLYEITNPSYIFLVKLTLFYHGVALVHYIYFNIFRVQPKQPTYPS